MTLVEFGAPAIVCAVVAVATGTAAQTITGFGFGLVVVPVLTVLVGGAHAVRLVNLLGVAVNVVLLAREHRTARLSLALVLLLPALVVTPLAAFVVHRTDPHVLSVVIGAFVVACALVLASGWRAAGLRGAAGMIGAGAISSAMNTASGVGGPAVAMYALNAEWPIELTRPTLQVFFLGLNALSFLALGPVGTSVGPGLCLVAAIGIGFMIGSAATPRLSAAMVRRAVLWLAVAGGTVAIVRGLG